MAAETRPSSPESATLVEVHAAIGQSVILYQHLERILKSLLPFIRTQSQPAPDNPISEMKKLLESKNTMGLLVGRLKNSVEMPNPEEFHNYLTRVVDNRNELVHTFLNMDFGNLATDEARNQALAYLKNRYEYALPLLKILQDVSATFGELLMHEDPEPRSIQQNFTVNVPRLP